MGDFNKNHGGQALHQYIAAVGVREHKILKELRAETAEMPLALMQIAPDQCAFMALLVKMIGARRILEIGVFTGYSSLAMALALPADGRLVALDVSEDWTAIARRYWQAAGVDSKIDLRLAPAADSLAALLDGGDRGSFDLAFIDADKENYDLYYERSMQLVRPGGLILLDNAFYGGDVLDRQNQNENARAIDDLNRKIHTDDRVDISLLTIGDGLMMCRRRS